MTSQAKGRTAVFVWIDDGDIKALIDDNGRLPVQIAGQDVNVVVNSYGWDSDAADWDKLQLDTNQRLKVINPDAGYIHVQDKKAQNTNGGTFTSGSWQTRDINDEVSDTEGICSVASNQITLDAGSYRCRISCPAAQVNRHQSRLYNITASSTLLTGTSEWAYTTGIVGNRTFIVGRFTLSIQSVLEIQHRAESTVASTGLGVSGNFTDEIYTVAIFERE